MTNKDIFEGSYLKFAVYIDARLIDVAIDRKAYILQEIADHLVRWEEQLDKILQERYGTDEAIAKEGNYHDR